MSMYPLQDCPAHFLPGCSRDAAYELHRNIGAPMGLVVPSVLTAMALAMQGLINVRRMDGLESPVSLFLKTVALSGERKSALDEKNLGPVREFEVEQVERYNHEMSRYEAAMLAWDVENKVILRAIERCASRKESAEQHKQDLEEHHAKKPKRPRLVKLLYNDATPGAIKSGLHDSWPSIGIVSDEGAGIFDGEVFTDLSLPNTTWSGGTISVDRVNRKSLMIREPRLTISIQIQPGPLHRHFERKGEEARDTGFLARFLISYPQSTQGTRFIYSPTSSWEHLPKFHARIRELLAMNVGPDGDPPEKIVLSFSPEAQARWIDAYNDIEAKMNPGQYFQNVKDYAAKIADNLARLAALFHFFEGKEGPISLDTLEQALGISVWFADEFVRLFSPPPEIPQEQLDATRLEIWFAQFIRRMGNLVHVKRNYVLQCAPEALRRKGRLNLAFDVLIGCGKIRMFMQGKTSWVALDPNYFTPQQVDWLCAQGAMGR